MRCGAVRHCTASHSRRLCCSCADSVRVYCAQWHGPVARLYVVAVRSTTWQATVIVYLRTYSCTRLHLLAEAILATSAAYNSAVFSATPDCLQDPLRIEPAAACSGALYVVCCMLLLCAMLRCPGGPQCSRTRPQLTALPPGACTGTVALPLSCACGVCGICVLGCMAHCTAMPCHACRSRRILCAEFTERRPIQCQPPCGLAVSGQTAWRGRAASLSDIDRILRIKLRADK